MNNAHDARLGDRPESFVQHATASSAPEHTSPKPEYHRPELFIAHEFNGLTVAVDHQFDGMQTQAWQSHIKMRDGRRTVVEADTPFQLDGTRVLFRPALEAPPIDVYDGWSAASRAEWLAGRACSSPTSAFESLIQTIDAAVEFAPDAEHGSHVVAAWILMTYFMPLFDAVPYLHFHGTAGSGKSTILKLIGQLAFRPLNTANITPAALYRSVHECGGTLLIDEAEQYKGNSELGRLLNAGYARGASVCRMTTRNRMMKFDVYGPKALGSINPLNPALESRTIRIGMVPASPEANLKAPSLEQVAALRDQLHVLTLERSFDLQEVLGSEAIDVVNRQRDLWRPLLKIACWLENDGLSQPLEFIKSAATADSRAQNESRVSFHVEQLLYALLRLRLEDVRPTPTKLLRAVMSTAPEEFEGWKPARVSSELCPYMVRTERSNGSRVFKLTVATLIDLIKRHGMNPDVALQDPNGQGGNVLAANAA